MSRSPKMISSGRGTNMWPPMGVVLGALRHARIQGVSVYLIGTDGGWRMATGLDEAPADSAIWEFPASGTGRQRQDRAGA